MIKLFNNNEILQALLRIEKLLTIVVEDVEYAKEARERQLLKASNSKQSTTMIRK